MPQQHSQKRSSPCAPTDAPGSAQTDETFQAAAGDTRPSALLLNGPPAGVARSRGRGLQQPEKWTTVSYVLWCSWIGTGPAEGGVAYW